jgi:putative membrane protein
MKFLGLLIRGFLMGSADVVPGVSGGTMALITGIYTRLIDAIKSVDAKAISYLLTFKLKAFFAHIHWQFLVPLFSGIVLAILFFTRVIPLPILIFTHPEPIYGLFFGLIIGSIVLLMMDIRPLNLKKIVSLLLGTMIGFWIVNLVPTSTPDALWFILLSGMIAITAMILPGISGSFILLILGKYSYIFGQFAEIGGPQTWEALIILVTFGLGVLLGLATFSRVLSWLLHRYNIVTLCVLIGFLLGTLSVIWPWQTRDYETLTESIYVNDDDPRLANIVTDGLEPLLPEYYIAGDLDAKPKEIIRVRKKLIHSEPQLPSNQQDVLLPIISMITGLIIVLGIGHLAKKQQKKE